MEEVLPIISVSQLTNSGKPSMDRLLGEFLRQGTLPRNRKQRALSYIRRKNELRKRYNAVERYPLIWKRDKCNPDAFVIEYSFIPPATPVHIDIKDFKFEIKGY